MEESISKPEESWSAVCKKGFMSVTYCWTHIVLQFCIHRISMLSLKDNHSWQASNHPLAYPGSKLDVYRRNCWLLKLRDYHERFVKRQK